MSTWARKNLNVVVYMRNRACSARAPPVAAVTRMMTAKCVGTNRKATITNMMTRALLMAHPRRDKIRGRRAPAPVASNSSRSITKPTCFKHRMLICKLKPHVKRLRIRSNVPASEPCVKTNKAEFEQHGQLRDVKVNHADSNSELQENKVKIGDGDRINEAGS